MARLLDPTGAFGNMAPEDRTPSVKIDFSQDYDTSSLKGRSALVTGGSTGIGQGCAVGLAEAGAYVTIADVNEEAAQQVVKNLTDKGLRAQFIKTDVTSWPSLVAAFKAALSFSPKNTIDIVIPNAGISGQGSTPWIRQTPLDENGDPLPPSARVLDINFTAVYNTAHLALYYFRTHPGDDLSYSKHILYVSSIAGYGPMRTILDYGPSKWGVRAIFKNTRDLPGLLGEGKPKLKVNLVAPSWVRTPMTEIFVERLKEGGVKVAEVADVVHVVLRMCADEAVQGRAAAITPDRTSFDLCDDSESGGAAIALAEARKKGVFGNLQGAD